MADTDVQKVSIVIKKGQGLTQALRDHANKLGMEKSDGTISKQEWNRTIDKLVEINQKRKEAGQGSIFTGGTDRHDYKHSFVVHPNQKIDFTEEEINSLYESMGVSLRTTAAAQQQEQTPAANGEQTPATNGEQEALQEGITKRTRYDENNHPIGATEQEVQDGKLIRETELNAQDKRVKESTYKYDEDGNRAGKNVQSEFNAFDKPEHEEEFDKDDNLVATKDHEYYDDGDLKKTTTFDKDGNKTATDEVNYKNIAADGEEANIVKDNETHKEFDLDGNVTKSVVNKFENDKIVRETTKDENDNTTEDIGHEYNDQGQESKKIVYDIHDPEKQVSAEGYEYDENGNVSKTTFYGENDEDIKGSIQYEYNEDGSKKTETEFDAAGKKTELRELNEKGQTVKTTEYDPEAAEETVKKVTEAEFNDKDQKVKDTVKDAEGNVTETVEYEYNEQNQVVKEVHKDAQGNVTQTVTNTYDENGNLTETNRLDSNGNRIEENQAPQAAQQNEQEQAPTANNDNEAAAQNNSNQVTVDMRPDGTDARFNTVGERFLTKISDQVQLTQEQKNKIATMDSVDEIKRYLRALNIDIAIAE